MFLGFTLLAVSASLNCAYTVTSLHYQGRNNELRANVNISESADYVSMRVVYRSHLNEYYRWHRTSGETVISLDGHSFVDSSIDLNIIRSRSVAELEVGPGSRLFQTISSVSLLKHTNQLVLDATEDEFLAIACQPDSSVTVPFLAMPAISLGWISSSVSGDFVLHEGLRSVDFSSVENSAMFILAPELAGEVFESLVSFGAVPVAPENHSEMRFLNCTRESATNVLPIFEMVLTDNDNNFLTRIAMSGEDYMEFNADLSCRSRFNVRGPGDNRESFVIDPFKLPGVSVRSTDRNIMFCDSL